MSIMFILSNVVSADDARVDVREKLFDRSLVTYNGRFRLVGSTVVAMRRVTIGCNGAGLEWPTDGQPTGLAR